MKVVMIGQKGIPAIFGGIERHVEELSSELLRTGVDVAVYCRRWYCNERESATNVRTIFMPSLHTKHLDAISHTFISTMHAIFVEWSGALCGSSGDRRRCRSTVDRQPPGASSGAPIALIASRDTWCDC